MTRKKGVVKLQDSKPGSIDSMQAVDINELESRLLKLKTWERFLIRLLIAVTAINIMGGCLYKGNHDIIITFSYLSCIIIMACLLAVSCYMRKTDAAIRESIKSLIGSKELIYFVLLGSFCVGLYDMLFHSNFIYDFFCTWLFLLLMICILPISFMLFYIHI